MPLLVDLLAPTRNQDNDDDDNDDDVDTDADDSDDAVVAVKQGKASTRARTTNGVKPRPRCVFFIPSFFERLNCKVKS